jgi:type IV secretion system protein VirD4
VLRADPIGKGVGLVVPSLLTWPGSAIVHDIKGENWQLTAGFRARHGRVLLFDPTNRKSSAAYNPLLEVRRGEWEVRDVQNIADILVDPEGSLERGTIGRRPATRCWSARSCTSSMPSRTRRWPASPPSCPIRSARSRRRCAMMKTPHLGEAGRSSRHRQRRARAAEQIRQRTLGRALDRHVVPRPLPRSRRGRGHARCDWRIADLVGRRAPTTLYLVVPPSDINRTKPLIRLILNQIGRG